MTMRPALRKFALTAHVASSVGWLGSVVGFLALAIIGLNSADAQTTRAVYVSMELIGRFVIVPFSFAALLTGLIQSFGTPWGLFRHYWVLTKFLLTIGATALLLLHMIAVSRAAGVATGILSSVGFRALQGRLVFDAGLALLVLLAATTLSVYKPWGLTSYGLRKQQHQQQDADGAEEWNRRSMSRGPLVYTLAAIGAVLLLVVLHLTGVISHH